MNVLKHGVLYLICFNLCIVRTVEIYNSCQDALERSCEKKNGVYNIKTTTDAGYSEIYCVLEGPGDPARCSGVGWTPVIYDPASGTDELAYDSTHWTGAVGLNVDGGKNFHNVTEQTLLPTFWSTKVSEICLENRAAGTHLTFPHSSRTLRVTFTGGQTEFSPVIQDWKNLKPDFAAATFPEAQTSGYFNYDNGDNRIRLGIAATTIYEVIGIGIRFKHYDSPTGGPGLQHYTEDDDGAKRAYALYVR